MIIWDFNVIMAFAISLVLGVVISAWLVYTLKGSRCETFSDGQFFRQCLFCSFLYFDYSQQRLPHCPRCGSYADEGL